MTFDWEEALMLAAADDLGPEGVQRLAQAVDEVRKVIEEYDEEVGRGRHAGMLLSADQAKRLRAAVGTEAQE